MAQDTKKPETPGGEALPKAPSLAELFRLDLEHEEQHVPLRMPPLTAPARRAARALPIPTLTGLSPFWIERGRGGTAKTAFARWFGGELTRAGVSRYVLAAADPSVRLLPEFFEGVMQPLSIDQAETLAWLRKLFVALRKGRPPGLIDMGGGDTSFSALIASAPNLVTEMEEAGVGLVAAYFLGTAPDDAGMIGADVARGFAPRATALIRSMHLADSDDAFNAMRSHPDYKAALERGAVEIVLPRLAPQALANQIELRRFQYGDARDGIVPKDNPHPPIDAGFYRAAVREWMEAMTDEVEPLAKAGWLPWGTA